MRSPAGLLTALALAACLGAAPGAVARAQGAPADLGRWVGKYPTLGEEKPRQNFFKIPAIERGLKTLLSGADRRFLLKTCGKEVPIERIDRYLIVRRCHSRACGLGAVTLVVNLEDGAMHVAVKDEDDPEQRWLSTDNRHTELPFEVRYAWHVIKGRR